MDKGQKPPHLQAPVFKTGVHDQSARIRKSPIDAPMDNIPDRLANTLAESGGVAPEKLVAQEKQGAQTL